MKSRWRVLRAALFLLLLFHLTSARPTNASVTYVTCLYDVGRGNMIHRRRTWDDYLKFFGNLLKTSANLVVYGEADIG